MIPALLCPHLETTDTDADGRRLCLRCSSVLGPPTDLAAAIAIAYLSVCRDMGYGHTRENTDEELGLAARLATN